MELAHEIIVRCCPFVTATGFTPNDKSYCSMGVIPPTMTYVQPNQPVHTR